MTTLDRRAAVVTGAAGGLGLATARAFHDAGYTVILVDLDPEVNDAAASIGEGVFAVVADIAETSGWADIMEKVAAVGDSIDVLVNNAGVYRRGPVATMSEDDIDLLYRVNQRAVILGVRAALPFLLRSSSNPAIVNVSSSAGITGEPEIAAYTGTKWAVRGLTKSLAAELAPQGIRVNCVIPGLTDTAMAQANGEGVNQQIIARTYLHRIGEPDEVASATVFLASAGASYITGAEIVVDGGLSV